MVKTISIGNFAGGIGKSTLTAVLGYLLAKRNNKVLLIDNDAQGNASGDLLETTFPDHIRQSRGLVDVYERHNTDGAISHASNNIDYIWNDARIENIGMAGERVPEAERGLILSRAIAPIANQYDYILIDLPPASANLTSTNALIMSDYVVIPTQMTTKGRKNTSKFIGILQNLAATGQTHYELVGILLYMLFPTSIADKAHFDLMCNTFGTALMEKDIKYRKRVEAYFENGITDRPRDNWDRDALALFSNVLDEILERISIIEKSE